jgi:hypothetical protein
MRSFDALHFWSGGFPQLANWQNGKREENTTAPVTSLLAPHPRTDGGMCRNLVLAAL